MALIEIPATTRGRIVLALKIIAVIAALWIVAALVYRVVVLPRQAATDKAEAIVQQETAEATVGAARDAMTTVTEVRREIVRIDATTRRNDDAIKSAAGAATRAPAVAAALRDSLCQRTAYIGEPDCTALRGDGGQLGAARADAGSAAPAE